MSSENKRQKRIVMVNRDFQMRYIRTSVLVAVCSTFLTMFLILYPLFYMRVLRFPSFLPPPFLIAASVAAILNFGMIAYLGVHLSHRIAGPVFAMVRHLRVLQSGQFTDSLRIRENDELKYLMRHINDLVDVLKMKTHSDLAQVNEIMTLLESSEPGGKDGSAKALDLCRHLKEELESRLVRESASKEASK